MKRIRVIPVLLIDTNGGLVKTIKFRKRTYIGDPINAVKIFNGKEVDELLILDIDASRDKREPNLPLITDIVSEAFIPVSYGGGVSNIYQMEQLFHAGIEKIVLRKMALTSERLIQDASAEFGSQSVVACIDVRKNIFGKYRVVSSSKINHEINDVARRLCEHGVGEIMVQSVDRDGTFDGYDLSLLRKASSAVDVPVIACGGAGSVQDFVSAITQGGCSAVAAGSMFLYQKKGQGILITYPDQNVLMESFYKRIV